MLSTATLLGAVTYAIGKSIVICECHIKDVNLVRYTSFNVRFLRQMERQTLRGIKITHEYFPFMDMYSLMN